MADQYLDSLLGENEHIILLSRQHWFVLLKAVLVEIVLAILIVVGSIVLNTMVPVVGLLGLILLIIPIVSFTHDALVWANKKYVVTNRRVMQLAGVLNKSVTDSSLEKVNDIHMEQSFFGRLFQFGDIEILTASELGVNLFKTIGNPVQFKSAMINAKALLEHEPMHMEGEDNPNNIPALIAKLDDLRKQGIITDAEFNQKKIDLLAKM